MSHTPFILAAYATTAMVLLWAAMSPVLQRRSFLRELKASQQYKLSQTETIQPGDDQHEDRQHGDKQHSDTQHRESKL